MKVSDWLVLLQGANTDPGKQNHVCIRTAYIVVAVTDFLKPTFMPYVMLVGRHVVFAVTGKL